MTQIQQSLSSQSIKYIYTEPNHIFQRKLPMIQTQNIPIEANKDDEQQMINQKFNIPYISAHQQVLTLNGQFDIHTQQPNPQGNQTYVVSNNMTIAQLRSMWYRNNIQYDSQKNNTEDKYVLMYNLDFPLYEYFTIQHIKNMVRKQKFDDDLLIRVYYQWDCPYQKDEAAMSYEKYQEEHLQQIQTAFKYRSKKSQDSCYFYVKSKLKTTIKSLKEQLHNYLSSQKQIIGFKDNDIQSNYTIKVKNDNIPQQKWKNIEKHLKQLNINQQQEQNSEIDFTQFNDMKLRDICVPGQIIYIEFLNEQNIVVDKKQLNSIQNKYIQIGCFEIVQKKKQSQILESSQTNQLSIKAKNKVQKIIHKKTIKRPYSQIRNVKASTLLFQQRIPDAILTSVGNLQLTINPDDKFNKFDQLINQCKSQKLTLNTFPQNFLYYKKLNELSDIKMQKILQTLQTNINFTVQHRQKCRFKRNTHIQKLDNQNYKDQNFLDPIILYTSPFVYKTFNTKLRSSSLSLIQKQQIHACLQNHWQYAFSQKLVKSLNKLPNTQLTCYRSSINYQYNFSVGQIIQWNNFTSTSKQLSISQKFICSQFKQQNIQPSQKTTNLTYIFQMQVYSGKDIESFSFYPTQKQVLLLPYSKFKVVDQRRQVLKSSGIQVTWVKLVQIPIPKKIPGNIFVWIDANIHENSKAFNKIIEANNYLDCDLIQLVSNDHFEMWLKEFKETLTLPEVNVHFVSNMNRAPQYNNQGIHTLQIIRTFNQTAKVIFYIGNVTKTRGILNDYWGANNKMPDSNIEIVQSLKGLNSVFQSILNKQKGVQKVQNKN